MFDKKGACGMDAKQKARCLGQLRYLKMEGLALKRRMEAVRADRAKGEADRLVELRRLAVRRRRCMKRAEALTAFIEGVDDSLVRQILAYRYEEGLTWRAVAAHIGERDEQYPRRIHNRYLERAEWPGSGGSEGDGAKPPEAGRR